jgi:hypothetical protein
MANLLGEAKRELIETVVSPPAIVGPKSRAPPHSGHE